MEERNTGGEVGKAVDPTGDIFAHQNAGKGSGEMIAVAGHQMVPEQKKWIIV